MPDPDDRKDESAGPPSETAPDPAAVTPGPRAEGQPEQSDRPRPVLPGSFEHKDIDWDREVGAWEATFPLGDEPTRPGLTASPPPPDSDDLVLDDVSADILLDDVTLKPAKSGQTPAPVSAPPSPSLDQLFGEEQTETTLIGGPPGMEPQALLPREQESSSILIIPDVSELEAAVARPAGDAPTLDDSELAALAALDAATVSPPVDDPGRGARSGGRELVDDGLPDLSGVWQAPTPEPSELAPTGWPAGPDDDGGAFAEVLPAEAATPLVLEIPAVSWAWSPDGVAEEVVAGVSTGQTPGQDYWRAQLALAMDELAAAQRSPGGAPPERLAAVALWAARAAERTGHGDALRLYDQALAWASSGSLAATALRGQFRLLSAAGATTEAAEKLAALVEVAPAADRPAYQAMLGLATGQAGPPDGPGPDGDRTGTELPALVIRAERAFAAGDRAAAGEVLLALADGLQGASGQVLRELAVLSLESVDPDRAPGVWQQAGETLPEAGALARLRQAACRPAEDVAVLGQAAQGLAGTPLAGALRRWTARLSRRRGQPVESGQPADLSGSERTALPWPERLDALAAELSGVDAAALTARFDGLVPEVVPLLARRLAVALGPSRASAALEVLEHAAGRSGHGDPVDPLVALSAEPLTATQDPAVVLAAWRLVAEHDPSRRAHAFHARAQLQLRAPDPQARAAGLESLAASVDAARGDGAFWTLSWQQRKLGRPDLAAEALAAGASAWDSAGLDPIARTLRDRAVELDAAARPERLLSRLPAQSFAVDVSDDPRALARTLLSRANEPLAVAAAWKDAATGGGAHRVVEAAGWLIEAGKPAEALNWLADTGSDAQGLPALSLLRRRLLQAGDGCGHCRCSAAGVAGVGAGGRACRAGHVAGRGAGAGRTAARGDRAVPRAAGGTAGRRRRSGAAPGAVDLARRGGAGELVAGRARRPGGRWTAAGGGLGAGGESPGGS